MGLQKDIKFSLLRSLLAAPIYFLLRLYVLTLRVRVGNAEEFEGHLEGGGRVVFCCWHQRLFVLFCYPRLHQLSPCLMISQSRDGDVVADIAKRLGGLPVRGSSTRGGERALREMISEVMRRRAGVHIVDGPQGPGRVIKPGLITLAQKARAAVCPIYVSYEKTWIFKSWDRFMLPKPFSRVLVGMGPLESVSLEADASEFERIRRDIEEKMIRGYEEADRHWQEKKRP